MGLQEEGGEAMREERSFGVFWIARFSTVLFLAGFLGINEFFGLRVPDAVSATMFFLGGVSFCFSLPFCERRIPLPSRARRERLSARRREQRVMEERRRLRTRVTDLLELAEEYEDQDDRAIVLRAEAAACERRIELCEQDVEMAKAEQRDLRYRRLMEGES